MLHQVSVGSNNISAGCLVLNSVGCSDSERTLAHTKQNCDGMLESKKENSRFIKFGYKTRSSDQSRKEMRPFPSTRQAMTNFGSSEGATLLSLNHCSNSFPLILKRRAALNRFNRAPTSSKPRQLITEEGLLPLMYLVYEKSAKRKFQCKLVVDWG